MTLQHFIAELRRLLPDSAWPWVISALREDTIVWESLEGEVGARIIGKGSIDPEDYSPAAFALTALDVDVEPEKLRQQPIRKIDTDIQPPRGGNQAVTRLVNHGLAALKVRDRRRLTGSYQGIFEDLNSMSPTTLACLYAMIPDPFELLSGLMAQTSNAGSSQNLACSHTLHIILANPLPPQTQAPIIRNILNGLPLSRKIYFLQLLHARRPQLASQLASPIAKGNLLSEGGSPSIFDKLEAQYWVANAWSIAENPTEEARTLAETVNDARQLQAKLSAQLAMASSKNNDPQNAFLAWEQALRLEPDKSDHFGDFILALIDNDRHSDARERLKGYHLKRAHPKILLARALMDQVDGDNQSARENAKKAFSLLSLVSEASQTDQGGDTTKNHVFSNLTPYLIRITKLFLQLNAPYEAVQSVELIQEDRPNDVECLELATNTFRYAGDPIKATHAAHLAVALAPQRTDLRIRLIHALEAMGDWQQAISERSILLDHSESASPPDRLAYARCSLKAGSPSQAIETCEEILQDEPNNGHVHAILGEAYYALGEPQKALERLELATQLSPDQAFPWKALARIQRQEGRPDKSLEALKSGVQTSPNLPELQLALGELHMAEDRPTQALNVFKKAAELIGLNINGNTPDIPIIAGMHEDLPDSKSRSFFDETNLHNRQRDVQIALRLGQALQQLGHSQQAYQVLGFAYSNFPFDPSIAYAYAKILIELDQISFAIDPLEVVLQSSPDIPEPYLDYAGCLLSLNAMATHQEKSNLPTSRALEAINTALEIEPDNGKAKAYLAEALFAKGDYQDSLDAYRQALETDLSKQPTWFSRLSLGLGQVALELGHIETSIAALQEANQANPANVGIKRTLAEAYQAAGLHQEAYQTAQAALHQAPDDLETLIWFAEHILILGDNLEMASANAESEAIGVLKRALQIDPYRTDLAARLGHIYLKVGNNEAAKETFHSLLADDKNDPVTGYHSTSRDVITDLHQTARGFLLLGDAHHAVASLERALQTKPTGPSGEEGSSPGSSTPLITLLEDLALAYQFSGNAQSAIKTLEQAIPLAEAKTPLYLSKADIYLDLEEYYDALETLTSALDADPDNPELHYRLALIQRAAGNTAEALEYANTALSLSESEGSLGSYADILVLAAELHQALLQDDASIQILHDRWDFLTEKTSQALARIETKVDKFSPGIMDYFCLHAEQAIATGDFEQAIQDLGILLEISPDHPRVMVIQARLAALRFDKEGSLYAESERLLDSALARGIEEDDQAIAQVEQPEQTYPIDSGAISHPQSEAFYRLRNQLRLLSSKRAMGEAALDLNRWKTSIEQIEKVSQASPTEPYAHLSLARVLVITAEYQRLCEELEAIAHTPGGFALEEDAYQKFKKSIDLAETFLKNSALGEPAPETSNDQEVSQNKSMEIIKRWHARGEVVFHPSFQNAELLSHLALVPENIAAHIASLRLIGDTESAALAANSASHHPLVLAQLALTLVSENPRQSLAAAHAAVEILAEKLEQDQKDDISLGSRNLALIHALAARLVHQLGNRSSDQKAALNAIRVALAIWPDEPRWHYLAGEVHLKSEDPDVTSARLAAIAHLEEACSLEPNQPDHPLELGRIFLMEENPDQAIIHLEKATQLNQDLSAAWFHLARAQRMVGEIDQALISAAKAVSLSQGEIAPLLLRGEIALLAEDANQALELTEKALRLDAENPATLLLKAKSLSDLNQPDEALEAIETALPYADDPLPLFLERIRLIHQAQGSDAALDAVQGLAEAYPDEPKVLACLARHLEDTNREEEAIQAVQHAIRTESVTSPPNAAERSKMHHLLGRLLKNAGQLDQAIHHLTEAIRLNSRQVEPYLELGRVHQERRQHAQALKAYDQAIAARPDDHRAYYEAGVALKENKDYLEAERMLRKAAELAPNDLTVHRLLGAVVALNLVHNRRKASIDI